MKNFQNLMMAAALVASAALTSCSSEVAEKDNPVASQGDIVTYQVSIPATKGTGAITRGLSLDDANNALTSYWASGDVVYVYDSEDNLVSESPLTPQETGTEVTTTLLMGTLAKEGGFAQNETLTLYFLKNKASHGDYSNQVGTIDDIKTNFDYATATVTVLSVFGESTDNIMKTSDATFTRSQAITKFTFDKSITSLTIRATGLKNDGTNDGELTVTPVGEGGTTTLWVAMHNTSNETDPLVYTFTAMGSDNVSYTATKSVYLQDNKYYVTNITLERSPLFSNVTVEDIEAEDYNNNAHAPVLTVMNGSTALTLGDDYTVSYKQGDNTVLPENVKDVGDYTVVVTPTGAYTGDPIEKTFTISKGTTAITATGITDGETILTVGTAETAIGAASSLDPDGVAFTYSASPENIVTIDSNGNITPVGAGIVTITVYATGPNIIDASETFTIAVRQAGIGGGFASIETSTGGWQ